MLRVFLGLAGGQLALMLIAGVTGAAGITLGVDVHIRSGLCALVLGCLVQVVVFTYFTATGKMISQAVHLGGFSMESLVQANALKRPVTLYVLAAAASLVAVAVSGGIHWRTRSAEALHWAMTSASFLIQWIVFVKQYELIGANSALMDKVMSQYAAQRPGHTRSGGATKRIGGAMISDAPVATASDYTIPVENETHGNDGSNAAENSD